MSGFITHLSGQWIASFLPKIWLCRQGITYEIHIPMSTFYELERERNIHVNTVHLYIHQIIREDTQELFGFKTFTERELFRFLIKVSGIGSRTGLAVLSTFSTDELLDLIDSQNITGLTSIPGVGTKTAERLVLELKDKGLRTYFHGHHYFAQQQVIEKMLHQNVYLSQNFNNLNSLNDINNLKLYEKYENNQDLIQDKVENNDDNLIKIKNTKPTLQNHHNKIQEQIFDNEPEQKYHTKQELFQALQGLGYSEKDCVKIYVKLDKTLPLIDAIKGALRLLSKH